jgi:hypothetical protein
MPFQITALLKSQFEHLFAMNAQELAEHGAIRQIVIKKPGFPCRVSLADADIGEEVLLVHYEHQSADTPFRSSHAVYVRPNGASACPRPNEVPDLLRSRILSLRAFNAKGMMVCADLADGSELESAIERTFANPDVEYLHLHFAKPGCYAARVDRS